MFRDATIDDSGAAARLIALVNPEGVISPAGFRHAWESTQPSARRASWCVEADGECVAWATATLMVETSEPGVGWIGVTVHPQHRGRGLGTALLDRAEQHAREIGVRRVLSWSRSDDASATFVRSHGFEQTASDEILKRTTASTRATSPRQRHRTMWSFGPSRRSPTIRRRSSTST